MKRRTFLKQSGMAGLAAAMANPLLAGWHGMAESPTLGVALFTLPKALNDDLEGTLRLIAQTGYREVEFFGPYDFSVEEAKKQWQATAAFLGFAGSGYFGRKPAEMRRMLDDLGLRSPSIHCDWPTVQQNMGPLAEAAHAMGHRYVGIAAIPDDMRRHMDDYKRTADAFNQVGEAARKEGLTFFYHNHGYGHKPVNGVRPFEWLVQNTNPDNVKLQMDVFWMSAAGADAIGYLRQYPGRFKLLHLKDMREKKTFSGDGSTMGEWMTMFPLLADAGDGVIDLCGIMAAAKAQGAEHFLLEKDLAPAHEQALSRSYGYLKGLDLGQCSK